jgi:hypothetical protein
MSWLEHDLKISVNPCKGVKRRPENQRHLFLDADEIAAAHAALVVHHSDFDVLIPSHSRMGKFFGGRRISMLRGTPG